MLVSFDVAMPISHYSSFANSAAHPIIAIKLWLDVGICGYALLANLPKLIDFSRHSPSSSLKVESAHP